MGDLADVTQLRSVEGMIRESLGALNATACLGALKACSRLHQPDKAAWIIQEMRRLGPQPDAGCYSLAIDVCARKGHWSVADGLLSSMQHEEGLQPEASSFAVVMAACHRAGQSERVLELLGEMEASGVRGGSGGGAYATAIHAALAGKQHGKMLAVVEQMLDKGLEVEERLIHPMMGELVKEGKWEEGRKLLALARRGGRLTGEVYAKAVEACVPEGQWSEAFKLLEEMDKEGFLKHVIVSSSEGGDSTSSPASSSSSSAVSSSSSSSSSGEPTLLQHATASAAEGSNSGSTITGGSSSSSSNNLAVAVAAAATAAAVEASEAAYRAAMSACRRAGKMERVFALLDLRDALAEKKTATTTTTTSSSSSSSSSGRSERSGIQSSHVCMSPGRENRSGLCPVRPP